MTGGTACSSGPFDTDHQLTVAVVVDPSWSHVPVAQKAGYFKAHGTDVKVVNFSTGPEAIQALTAGQVDIVTAAAVPTSAALTKSPTLRIIADGSRWKGSRIVARKNSGITTLADLAGKSIGTPLGTSAAYFASTVYLASESATKKKAADLTAFFATLGDASKDHTAHSGDAVAAVAEATKLDPALLSTVLKDDDFSLQLDPTLAETPTALGKWAQSTGNIAAGVTLPDYQQFLDDTLLKK